MCDFILKGNIFRYDFQHFRKKKRLEVPVEKPQELKDEDWTIKEEESACALSPPAVQRSTTPGSVNRVTCPSARSCLDTALARLTRNFADLMKSSASGLLDLNYACEVLNVPKRRLYDVVNVLEGAHIVTKEMKNSVQWIGPLTGQNIQEELMCLQEKEIEIDRLIENCSLQIYQLFENQPAQKFAYLTYEDLSRIPDYREQQVIVIKAPAGARLKVPHPDKNLCIHVMSKDAPIEVFVCSEELDSGRRKVNDANRNPAPLQAASSSLHADAKDAGPASSLPVSTSLSGRRLTEDHQPTLSSAEQHQGILDLFNLENLEQMHLDLLVETPAALSHSCPDALI